MNASLKHLLYVKKAADLLSIAKASLHLNISQSAIGSAINNVEQEFNIQIFVRQPSRGLILTQSGRVLISKINGLIANVEQFENDAKGVTQVLEGHLNVGCFTPMSTHFLPSILKAFTAVHPDVIVNLHEGDLREVQRALFHGEVDLIISYDLGLSEGAKGLSFANVPPHVILPHGHALQAKSSIDLNDLVDQPMIMFDLPESRTYFELMFAAAQIRPKVAYRSENYETVRGMVAAGLGFSILNLRPLIDYAYGGLPIICRPLKGNFRAPQIKVVWRDQDELSTIAKIFVEACETYFQSDLAPRHLVNK